LNVDKILATDDLYTIYCIIRSNVLTFYQCFSSFILLSFPVTVRTTRYRGNTAQGGPIKSKPLTKWSKNCI